jgi:hypothetical protein
MKVLGRWATVGYAILAVVLGAAIAAVARKYMMPTTQIFDLQRISDGTNLAFVTLVSTPVLVLTLILASSTGALDDAQSGGRRHLLDEGA